VKSSSLELSYAVPKEPFIVHTGICIVGNGRRYKDAKRSRVLGSYTVETKAPSNDNTQSMQTANMSKPPEHH
jgi:hypothetical protein